VGYFVAATALVYVALIVALLKPDADDPNDKATISLVEARAQIARSRCWVNYHIAFINNFQGAVTQYFLPVFCRQKWGFDQVTGSA
jgi:hypothetical protein